MLKNKTLEGKEAEGPTEKIEVIKKTKDARTRKLGKWLLTPEKLKRGVQRNEFHAVAGKRGGRCV